MDPYMMAGIEGVWGTILWLILLPILEHIPCNPTEGVCTRNGTMEFSVNVFKEYSRNPMNIVLSIIIVGFMPLLYGSALNITSYGSAAARTTVETARNFMIWGFFLIVPVYGRIIEKFSILQLTGFMILMFGVLLYNEMLVLPCLGFSHNTKVNKIKRKHEVDFANSKMMSMASTDPGQYQDLETMESNLINKSADDSILRY